MIEEKTLDNKRKIILSPQIKTTSFSFVEDKNKYLFDRNKTVGFRKDKKINKFVGLRDGQSKQLEFTIKSILIDNNELIPNNRVNFNNVSLDNNIVVHEMNNTKILNKVTDTNFRNLIKVDNPFETFDVTYQVHLKGIKVKNIKIKNIYHHDKNNQFLFVDEGNDQILFIIDTPIAIDSNDKEHKFIKHELYIENDELFYKKSAENITDKYNFPLLIDTNVLLNNINLYTGGVGVIKSGDVTSWSDTHSGGGSYIDVVHSSSFGTYEEAIGVKYTPFGSPGTNKYEINRTFLNFDTSIFSSYNEVLSSAKLKLNKYLNDECEIFIYSSTQSNSISTADFKKINTDICKIDIGESECEIPFSYINLSGYSKFALLELDNDHNNVAPTTSGSKYVGLNFNGTTLELIFEPIKVYGQTTSNVIKGDYFDLYAYTNYGSTSTIEWYTEWDGENTFNGFLGSGGTYNGYSMEFIQNNKIYAVQPITGGASPYSTPLEIIINVTQLDYNTILTNSINQTVIDIDSIYFKYYKCLSGVCYTYFRDLKNVYESTTMVADSNSDISYNLYNEFDIIDEFFINSIQVDIASVYDVDLNKRYNEIDGVIVREGSRILLMNQNDINQVGIYVSKYDNKLIKTNEMDTEEKLYRLKIHVKYGTFADQEIHIGAVLNT